MNILAQFQQIFNREERGFAKVVGVRDDGRLIATTPSGGTVLLVGVGEVGGNVFYNRLDNQVLSEAPKVSFQEFGV